jgi:hypothetical protein
MHQPSVHLRLQPSPHHNHVLIVFFLWRMQCV